MTIETRRLGRTGFEVTALGLGAYQLTEHFGVGEEEALRIFAAAARGGIGYVDTAPMYAASEELLGRARAENPAWTPVISTKVGYFDAELGAAAYRDPAAIRAQVDRSRRRIGVDRLDVVMIHEPEWEYWDLDVDGRGVVTGVLRELRDEGVIGAIGLGGWGTERIGRMLESGLFDVALVAGGFTLLAQPLRDHVLPAAAEHGVGIVAGGAFGQGIPWLLAIDRAPVERMLRDDDFSTPHPNYPMDRATAEKLLDLYDLAEELGVSMTDLTVRYLLSEPGIHVHIPGAREAAHVLSNVAAAHAGPLDAGAVARIEA